MTELKTIKLSSLIIFERYKLDSNTLKITFILSYDVAFGSEVTLCIKIYKPLVVYRFSGNVMKLCF